MTIQITSPEAEDAEALLPQALQSPPPPTKDAVAIFEPLRGLNLDFGSNPSTGRPVDL